MDRQTGFGSCCSSRSGRIMLSNSLVSPRLSCKSLMCKLSVDIVVVWLQWVHMQEHFVYICEVHNGFSCWHKVSVWTLPKGKVRGWLLENRSVNFHLIFHVQGKCPFLVISFWCDSINPKMFSRDDTSHGVSCPRVVPREAWVYVGSFFSFLIYTPLFLPFFPLIFTAYVLHKTCGVLSLPHCLLFWSLILINHIPNLPVN